MNKEFNEGDRVRNIHSRREGVISDINELEEYAEIYLDSEVRLNPRIMSNYAVWKLNCIEKI